MRVRLEPLAGGYFEFLDELGHCQGCGQGYEKMHVVGHTTNAIKTASLVVDETEHIGVELSFVFLDNGWDAAVCAKDDVIGCLCVTHNFVYTDC